jgi:hypothetical protein
MAESKTMRNFPLTHTVQRVHFLLAGHLAPARNFIGMSMTADADVLKIQRADIDAG